ncbi:MAG: ATP-dependent sacrificial sulfur transferase LarE [Candidatus Omnitrophica bacterium]|nr:ATP-dependent sacrificial sulfur transferase LarE [Candidatus Omnitrophota bacterium]
MSKIKITSQNPKLKKLKGILESLKSVVVAYSGGLDSTFLLKVAVDTLGKDNVLAVTARSETYPNTEYRDARDAAKLIGARHKIIHTKELGIKNFKANPVNRCYYCKKELFRDMSDIRRRYGFENIADGANYDDLKDVRYGMKAAREMGIRSPLLEARIEKDEIRKFSRRFKLPTWDKPSFACLASRVPFHETITREALARIERAEAYLRRAAFKQVRVRLHRDIARLEFYGSDFSKILKERTRRKVIRHLKDLGFKYITLDLEGYRTGSMHEYIY